jgi:hypothetical protein
MKEATDVNQEGHLVTDIFESVMQYTFSSGL